MGPRIKINKKGHNLPVFVVISVSRSPDYALSLYNISSGVIAILVWVMLEYLKVYFRIRF